MNGKRLIVALLIIVLFSLNACVAQPSRPRVVYHDGGSRGYDRGYCNRCGTIRDVYQIRLRHGGSDTSGGGAILGAIIGGVLGNTIGNGDGRTAATAIGAVGGAVIGNSIERNNGSLRSGYAWQFRVELDDGQWATVTQEDNPHLRPGDRVILRGNHLELLRR